MKHLLAFVVLGLLAYVLIDYRRQIQEAKQDLDKEQSIYRDNKKVMSNISNEIFIHRLKLISNGNVRKEKFESAVERCDKRKKEFENFFKEIKYPSTVSSQRCQSFLKSFYQEYPHLDNSEFKLIPERQPSSMDVSKAHDKLVEAHKSELDYLRKTADQYRKWNHSAEITDIPKLRIRLEGLKVDVEKSIRDIATTKELEVKLDDCQTGKNGLAEIISKEVEGNYTLEQKCLAKSEND